MQTIKCEDDISISHQVLEKLACDQFETADW